MSNRKKSKKKSLREVVDETAVSKPIVINHPQGTHHTMSRQWLNDNGIIGVAGDAPDDVFRKFVRLTAVTPVPGDLFMEFLAEHGDLMVYRTMYGTYSYKTTLKLDNIPFAPKEVSDERSAVN